MVSVYVVGSANNDARTGQFLIDEVAGHSHQIYMEGDPFAFERVFRSVLNS